MEVVYFISGVIIATVLICLLRKSLFPSNDNVLLERLRAIEAENNQLFIANNTLDNEKLRLHSELSRLKGLYEASQLHSKNMAEQLDHQCSVAGRAKEELATIKERLQSAEQKLTDQRTELEDLGNRFKLEFKDLANSILEEKTQKFTQINEEKLKLILDPFKVNLSEFRQKVEETYDKESKERFSLGREVQRLMEMTQMVSQEANNLTSALKGDTKKQGNWGEMILESLLEHCGLTKGREYLVQEYLRDNAGNVIKDEKGKGLQPDVQVIYPDQRKVIIDSKVSLIAYEQYTVASTIEEQRIALMDHMRSVKLHIDGLCRKDYSKYAGSALDYVLLFMPVEPAWTLAMRTDTQLWKYAYDRRILIVSPTNLLAVLKIISDLWKIEKQNRHAIDIAEKAGQLYDKFVGFIENMETLGKNMRQAQNCYDEAFKQLSTGRGNLVGKVEQLKKIGAKAGKQLPGSLVTVSEE